MAYPSGRPRYGGSPISDRNRIAPAAAPRQPEVAVVSEQNFSLCLLLLCRDVDENGVPFDWDLLEAAAIEAYDAVGKMNGVQPARLGFRWYGGGWRNKVLRQTFEMLHRRRAIRVFPTDDGAFFNVTMPADQARKLIEANRGYPAPAFSRIELVFTDAVRNHPLFRSVSPK